MSNYAKGRAFEDEIKKNFEKYGYHVMRTVGYHSLFDLIAIKENKIYFVQCKYNQRITKRELEELEDFAKKHIHVIVTIAYKKKNQRGYNLRLL